MSIPQTAIDRFMMLRGKADSLYAAHLDAQHAWEREWNETKRIEGFIRAQYPNQHIEISAEGQLSVIQRLRGNPHIIGYAATFPDSREQRIIMKLDDGTQRNVKLLLAARRRLAQADANRQRVNNAGNGLLELVTQCERLLRARGWSSTGLPEVRL